MFSQTTGILAKQYDHNQTIISSKANQIQVMRCSYLSFNNGTLMILDWFYYTVVFTMPCYEVIPTKFENV